MIMLELGKAEDEIFKKRQQNELNFKAREKAKRRRTEGYNQDRPNWALLNNTQFAPRVSWNIDSGQRYISILLYFSMHYLD